MGEGGFVEPRPLILIVIVGRPLEAYVVFFGITLGQDL